MSAIRFIIFGDSKGKDYGINEKILTKILKESCKLKPLPEFIVMLGDNVAGSEKEDILHSQLVRLRTLIKKFHGNILLLPVVGNHEVNIEPIDDRYELIFKKIYSDMLPTGFLGGYNGTVYYKDFQDTRFIVLNSFHYGALHKIDDKQLNWFKNAASAHIKNKLLFVHSPGYPTGAHYSHCLDLYPENRDAFWHIVDSCGIDIVFSSHEHNYSRRIIDSSFSTAQTPYERNVFQIISGGAGEKLRDKYVDKKGVIVKPIAVYHFLVVDVEASHIKVCAINYHGKKIDEFSID